MGLLYPKMVVRNCFATYPSMFLAYIFDKSYTYIIILPLFYSPYSIEGEYVPMEGDEVKYRLCAIPPKNEKFQAVHVKIINLTPEVHHRWEE